jgi:hypothetical protein
VRSDLIPKQQHLNERLNSHLTELKKSPARALEAPVELADGRHAL